MDIEWLLLLLVNIHYIVRLLYPKNKWKLTPGPTSKKCFFLHPFWMELTLSTDDTVLTKSYLLHNSPKTVSVYNFL